jgi:hypothetical protein
MNKAVVAKGTALRTVRFAAQFSEFRKLMDSGNSAEARRIFTKELYNEMLGMYNRENDVRTQLARAKSNGDFLQARQRALKDSFGGGMKAIRIETIRLVEQGARTDVQRGDRRGMYSFRKALRDALHVADAGK